VVFTMPDATLGSAWQVAIDTRDSLRVGTVARAGTILELESGSLVVWTEVKAELRALS
jgi:hypothetical protein